MNAATGTKATFHEKQRFRQKWLWLMIMPCAAGALVVGAVFGHGMLQQLVFGEPWGNPPRSDRLLAVVGSLTILVGVLIGLGLPWLFAILRLCTAVGSEGLHVRFFPFRRRTIPFDGIRSCVARTYSPVLEYGGWGIRWGPSGKAYNVSGNRGVQLELVDGKRLLIGSQRADELAEAIQAGMQP